MEGKIKIREYNIHYIKVGNGPHNVLCLPGSLGNWMHFKPQMESFDRDKFTLVVWDPPGYGESRPPNKKFVENFYETDAEYAYELMKALHLPKYSLLGFCGGGIISMIHAAKYPSAVDKMVIWSTKSFILPSELNFYENLRDVTIWSKKAREPLEHMYGDFLPQYLSEFVDGVVALFKAKDGNICSEMLKDILCPTLILYGAKDPAVDSTHASHLQNHIQGSRLHIYPEGKHFIHKKYAEDFNKRAQEFLRVRYPSRKMSARVI